MTTQPKKRFGGRQEGAGHPPLPPEQRKVRRVLFLTPDLDDWLVDRVGSGRAAVEHEIARIVLQHRDGSATQMSDTLPAHQVAEQQDKEYLWTADAFDRACDAGVFGTEARLELIHGRIMDRMGQGALHSILATLIAERLRAVLPLRLMVREEKPVRIAFDGEPVPDIMVVNRTILESLQYYATHQVTPEDVLLAIELAVTSAGQDTGSKALLYAQAGIGDYWVVLPEEGEVLVHRGPTPDGYASVVSSGAQEAIAPLAAPETPLSVRDLLGLPTAGEETP